MDGRGRWRAVAADGVAGLLVALFGVWFTWQALQLRAGPGYAAVGPQAFPVLVGLGLLGSGLALAAATVLAAARPPDADAGPPAGDVEAGRAETDWATLAQMTALLVLYVALFRPLGYVLATALFFSGGAWVLGSRRPLRDLVAGVAVSLVTFGVFVFLLGLELPAGPLDPAVDALRRLLAPAPAGDAEG